MKLDYSKLANSYEQYRKPDSNIADKIHQHIPKQSKVINIGAGLGSYEPNNCSIVSVEPSAEMITIRGASPAKVICSRAESLPFRDNEFDVAMAILTIHHWDNLLLGLQEMQRVSKQKTIILTWVGYEEFWLEDYLPEIKSADSHAFPSLSYINQCLGNILVETIEIPHNCTDGFMGAYWKRPECYLNPSIRNAISTFSRITNQEQKLKRLELDIDNGNWERKYHHLLNKKSLDLGYRLVVSNINNAQSVRFVQNL